MLWLAPRLAVAGLAVLALAPLGTRFGLWRYPTGLGLIGTAIVLSVLAALLGVAAGVRSGAWGPAGVAIGLGLVGMAIPLSPILLARGAPAIHDITTDFQDPPAFLALLPLRTGDVSDAAYDGAATADRQRAFYLDLGPVTLPLPMAAAFARALAASRSLGWTVVAADPASGVIEAMDSSRWFGFSDDVVVRMRASGEGTRIDVRSKSRVGRGDLGVNARRISAFLAKCQTS